jgi:RhtB (resistance to homoserine/threonine) family protein
VIDASILAFAAVAVVLVITPGADMALVMKNGLVHGRRAGVATALGINLGVAIWTAAAALGIAALVQSSSTAFTALKLAGAVYLAYLGIQAIRRAGAGWSSVDIDERRRPSDRIAFRQGVLSNLLNPKLAVFFVSLLPQFVSPGDPAVLKPLLLGAIFNVMGLIWLVTYAWAVGALAGVLSRRSIRLWIDRVTGAILVALGLRLATERSP